MGNSYYLYKDTTKWDSEWDSEKKKRIRVSEYIGRIDENGLVERNHRSIYEFGNSELLLSMADNIIPELKRCFPDYWKEILAMSMVRTHDPMPIRYMKSAWEKFYASSQIDASLSGNTISERLRDIGSNIVAQEQFFKSLAINGDRILFDLSSIFSRSENINLAEKGHNPKHLHIDQVNFALIFSGKRHIPVILEVLPGSVRDYNLTSPNECAIVRFANLLFYIITTSNSMFYPHIS